MVVGRWLWIVLGIGAFALCAVVVVTWPVEPPGRPKVPLRCSGRDDQDVCVIFEKECRGCHSEVAMRFFAGPDLVGLLGRKRLLASGTSLVADEAYIERAIADHRDQVELIPGYASSYDPSSEAPVPRSARQVKELAAYVMRLEPYELEAIVEVEEEQAVDDERVAKIRRVVQFQEDSLRNCYQAALALDGKIGGSFLVDFRAVGDSRFGAVIEEYSASRPVLGSCMEESLRFLRALKRKAPDGRSLVKYRFRLTAREPQ